jgi:hypothetical protein
MSLSGFQHGVKVWAEHCFGAVIARDKTERNYRFLEEALELVQSTGMTQDDAHQLVDYVFGRPVGDPKQETGGTLVTLALLCEAHGISMSDQGNIELLRILVPETMERIRKKQQGKPHRSPLPGPTEGA